MTQATHLEVGHWVSETERIIELRQFKYGWRATLLDQSMANTERKVKSTDHPDGLEVWFKRGEPSVLLPWPTDYPPIEDLKTTEAPGYDASGAGAPEQPEPGGSGVSPVPYPATEEAAFAAAAPALPPWPDLADLRHVEPRRDRMGRPIVLVDGEEKHYTRVTTFVGSLEDKYQINKWETRLVARGMADRPDLQLAAIAHEQDRDALQGVAEQAFESAKGHAQATTGTALHALSDTVDRGEPLPPGLPDSARADLAAYRAVTHGLRVLALEQFTVHDDLKLAGTPDRILEAGGGRYIGDLKTGRIDYSLGKFAMQFAVYSRSVAYDLRDGTRTPLPGIDQDRGILVHVPAGTGTAFVYWIDIARGWDGVNLAAEVRGWRRGQSKLIEFWQPPDLAEAIQTAPDVLTLEGLWYSREQEWTPDHVNLARQRKALIGDTTR